MTEGLGDGARAWNKTWVDKSFVNPVFEAAGVRKAWNLNHALRRTFGRTLWTKGVPLGVIAQLTGHEDTLTTKRYLGTCSGGVTPIVS
ncbi:MAG: tyrosine-type recombinase/integrase [Thermoplasmata archaeon]